MNHQTWPRDAADEWDGTWEEVRADQYLNCLEVGLPGVERKEQNVQEVRFAGEATKHYLPGVENVAYLVPCWLYHLLLCRPIYELPEDRVAWLWEVKQHAQVFAAAWRLGGQDALHAMVREVVRG